MNSLKTLEIILSTENNIKIKQSIGSVLHGMLMEHINPDYAALMHTQTIRPYSQSVYFDKEKGKTVWRISTFDKTAEAEILQAAIQLPEKVFLKQKGFDLSLGKREIIRACTYDELTEKYFANECNFNAVEFKFITSTSFKQNGNYVIYPQQALLFNSLLNKWNAFSDQIKLEDKNLAAELAEATFVANYNLSLNNFSVSATMIPAFRGKYLLKLKNNIMTKKIICLLADFSKYSGVGIKNALGMGSVDVNLIKW